MMESPPSVIQDAVAGIRPQVQPVQTDVITRVVPHRAIVSLGAVRPPQVVVVADRRELHSVSAMRERVAARAVKARVQPAQVAVDREAVIVALKGVQ